MVVDGSTFHYRDQNQSDWGPLEEEPGVSRHGVDIIRDLVPLGLYHLQGVAPPAGVFLALEGHPQCTPHLGDEPIHVPLELSPLTRWKLCGVRPVGVLEVVDVDPVQGNGAVLRYLLEEVDDCGPPPGPWYARYVDVESLVLDLESELEGPDSAVLPYYLLKRRELRGACALHVLVGVDLARLLI
ncbi:hypothetical protein ES703_85934 [subsurface metagenome]